MIDVAYVKRMARYNRWQNDNLYGAADGISDEERRRERGAFFGCIHGTLNHLLWGDRLWMSRFMGTPEPVAGVRESVSLYERWDDLKHERAAFDGAILDWADRLDAIWIAGDLSWYSGILQRELTKPKWVLLAHFFNHQTHHRGQVHCMLTQAGGNPHDTDLPIMPAAYLGEVA